MAKGKAHSDEVRAQAVAALLAGQGVSEVARQYKLPKSTVSRLKNSLAPQVLEQVGTEKRESLAGLIEEHLSTSLKSATKLAHKVGTDDNWFTKQSADEIAILYGVLTDKAIRILEAAEAASHEEE